MITFVLILLILGVIAASVVTGYLWWEVLNR